MDRAPGSYWMTVLGHSSFRRPGRWSCADRARVSWSPPAEEQQIFAFSEGAAGLSVTMFAVAAGLSAPAMTSWAHCLDRRILVLTVLAALIAGCYRKATPPAQLATRPITSPQNGLTPPSSTPLAGAWCRTVLPDQDSHHHPFNFSSGGNSWCCAAGRVQGIGRPLIHADCDALSMRVPLARV